MGEENKVRESLSEKAYNTGGRSEGDGKLCVYVLQEEASQTGWEHTRSNKTRGCVSWRTRVCVLSVLSLEECTLDQCIDSPKTNTKFCRPEDRRHAVSKTNKRNHENIVALTEAQPYHPHASIRPLLLLYCTQTVCPVHTKSITFWPIINKISQIDNSNSLCQQRNVSPLNALFQTNN